MKEVKNCKRLIKFSLVIIGAIAFYVITNIDIQKETDVSLLEEQLIETGYRELFMYGERSQAKSLWQDGTNREELENIVAFSSNLHAKFLAAELLRNFGVEPDVKNYEILAKAYAYALEYTSAKRENSVQLNGNLWGLLYEGDDAGHLGAQLILFDTAAILPLVKLLENDSGGIVYEGSQEATLGNSYQYRVKDFAAFYLSKIAHIPLQFFEDFTGRDNEIERLKTLLKEKQSPGM